MDVSCRVFGNLHRMHRHSIFSQEILLLVTKLVTSGKCFMYCVKVYFIFTFAWTNGLLEASLLHSTNIQPSKCLILIGLKALRNIVQNAVLPTPFKTIGNKPTQLHSPHSTGMRMRSLFIFMYFTWPYCPGLSLLYCEILHIHPLFMFPDIM